MLMAPDQPESSHRSTDSTRVWLRRLLILLTILSSIALILVIFWGASHITTSLLIVIVAALIAYAIVPVVEFFRRIMPRPLAILLAYLLVIIVLGGVIYFVVSTAIVQVTLIAHSLTHWLTPDKSGKSPLLQLLLNTGLTQGQIDSFQQQLVGSLSNVAGSLAGGLIPILGGVAGSLLNILLTVVISIYLLVDGDRPIKWISQIAPRSRRGQVTTTIDMVRRVVGGYIRGQILLCAIIGFLAGVGLLVLGFPYAALLGVLTFITEFIPVLGTIFAGAVAILLALTQGWVMAVEVVIFFVLLHLLEGYILAPRLVGRAVQLNPAVMLIALTVGSELFGPFGAIFAAPTAGLLHAIFTAIWLQYRQAHADEFADDPGKPVEKPAEKTAATSSSTTP